MAPLSLRLREYLATGGVTVANQLLEDLVKWRNELVTQLLKLQPEAETNRLRGAAGAVDDLIATLQSTQRSVVPNQSR